MSKLPVLSGHELVRALGKLGYRLDRQRGSHMIPRHESPRHRRLVVPDHDPIARGTLRAIIREAGLTAEELIELL